MTYFDENQNRLTSVPRGEKVQVTCVCGNKFFARVADRKRGWGKYCSKSCKAIVQVQTIGDPRKQNYDDEGDGMFGNFDNTSCQNE